MTDVWLIVKEVDGGVTGRPVLASLTAGTVPGHTSGGEVIETRRAVVGTAFTLPATSEIVPSGCWWAVSTGAHTWNVQLDANDPGTEGAPHLVGEPGIQVAAGTAPPTWDPSPVDSVNAKIGAVTLTAADVGAATTGDVTALGARIDNLDASEVAYTDTYSTGAADSQGGIDAAVSAAIAANTGLASKLEQGNNLSDVSSSSSARTNLGLGTAAVKNVAASGNAATTEVVKGDDTRLAKPSSIVQHTWAKDGVTGWSQQPISTDGVHAPNTLSVVAGRARIASAPSDTPSSYRECWLRDNTNWTDSEIRSIWYPPSSMDPAVCTPQMGHVHRASSTGAVVFDQNIVGAAYETTFLANWKWASDGNIAGFGIGLNTALTGGTAHYPLIRAVTRLNSGGWINVYFVDDPGNYAVGDAVTIAGCTDSTFNVNATITAVGRDPNVSYSLYGPYIITSSALTSAVSYKLEAGYVRFQAPAVNAMNPRLIYPMNVVSRLVGTVLSLKKWRVGKPEPAWGAPYMTATFDIAGDTNPVPPTSGKCGIMTNHIKSSGYVEYGDVTMTQL